MNTVNLIATATFGLESVVAYEVRKLGYEDITVENARVGFKGDLSAICRSNLWLRSADRVQIKVGEFKATTFEELFQQTKALPWPEWMPVNANFPVEGKSIKSELFSVSDCQAIVKKAVVESMKKKYKKDWFDETGPRFTIEVALLKDIATLTIDTTGPGLHKRGYRQLSSLAPIKETLAAGLLNISRWYPDRVLWDPCCGSGTIAIEAALMGLNMAPGLSRNFISEHWPVIPEELWKSARLEAQDAVRRDEKLRIYGTDIDAEVLSLARHHARRAGLDQHIHFQKLPAAQVWTAFKYGFIITNPPYAERMGEKHQVEELYRDLGSLHKKLDTWSWGVITSNPSFEMHFGDRADKKRKLYNGRVECQYYQYQGPRPPRPQSEAAVGDDN